LDEERTAHGRTTKVRHAGKKMTHGFVTKTAKALLVQNITAHAMMKGGCKALRIHPGIANQILRDMM
jgi:hypothetical protein